MVAAEIRAEMGRQGVNQSELGRRLRQNHVWVSSRVGRTGSVGLKIDEIVEMAEALGVSPQGFLSVLLPRLDSNQQPSGYPSSQVSDHEPEPLGPPERPHARVLMFRGRS